jgi:hypothetical protein
MIEFTIYLILYVIVAGACKAVIETFDDDIWNSSAYVSFFSVLWPFYIFRIIYLTSSILILLLVRVIKGWVKYNG